MTENQTTERDIPDDAGLTAYECPHHVDCDGIRCDPTVGDVPSSAPARVELVTITDRAAIQATDEPDERTPNEVHVDESGCSCKTGPSAESCADGPCEFHETVARAESAEAKVAAVEALAFSRPMILGDFDIKASTLRAALSTGEPQR